MVIDEKVLTKFMKKKFKGAGYTVAMCASRIWLIAPDWAVWCRVEQLPRKVLGLLAEHMGRLPGEGTAYKVNKAMGCQAELYDTSVKEIEETACFIENEGRRLFSTPLTFQGWDLWQMEGTERMVQIDPDLLALIKKYETLHYAKECCGISDMESGTYISVQGRSAVKDARLEHLEAFRWFKNE